MSLTFSFKSSFEMVKRLMLDVQRQKSISSRYNRTVSNSSDGNDIINGKYHDDNFCHYRHYHKHFEKGTRKMKDLQGISKMIYSRSK